MKSLWSNKSTRVLLILFGFVLVFLIFGIFQYYTLSGELNRTKADLTQQISNLETNLARVEFERTSLSDALYAEQNKNTLFEEQINDLAGTLGTLEKLSQTDPELLKKYSKVYFLNEHYVPEKLVMISPEYTVGEKEQWFHAKAIYFLEKLLKQAERDGVNIKIVSAYRSFGTQTTLKSGYSVTYGAGTANQFSADQGYSEHQLGTTVDFSDSNSETILTVGFQNSEAYEWLKKNAYKYGFVLSYPENNIYYQFEPWHWRFVGVKLAKKLDRDNIFFYDFDQRQIDSYLINLFDK